MTECEEELDENISEEDGRGAPDMMTKQTSKAEQDGKTNDNQEIQVMTKQLSQLSQDKDQENQTK